MSSGQAWWAEKEDEEQRAKIRRDEQETDTLLAGFTPRQLMLLRFRFETMYKEGLLKSRLNKLAQEIRADLGLPPV